MSRKLMLVSFIVNGLCNEQTIDNDVLPIDCCHQTINVAYDASISF